MIIFSGQLQTQQATDKIILEQAEDTWSVSMLDNQIIWKN